MVAIVRHLLRAALPGLACAMIGGAALAQDYIVVASTDPAIMRGLSLAGGQRLALAPGRMITLMHASGNLVTLKGAAGGVVAPARKAGDADAQRLEVLRTMVAPPKETVAGLGAARRTRGAGVCPGPAALTTLDAIALAQAAGCAVPAGQALEAWLAAQTPTEEN